MISRRYVPAWRNCDANEKRCTPGEASCSRIHRCVLTEMRTGHSKRSARGKDASDNRARYVANLGGSARLAAEGQRRHFSVVSELAAPLEASGYWRWPPCQSWNCRNSSSFCSWVSSSPPVAFWRSSMKREKIALNCDLQQPRLPRRGRANAGANIRGLCDFDGRRDGCRPSDGTAP